MDTGILVSVLAGAALAAIFGGAVFGATGAIVGGCLIVMLAAGAVSLR